MGIFLALLLIAVSSVIIWYSTAGFETAADYLGRNLTKGVKGATINAVASSMPEFLATIFFLFYIKDVNAFSGGIGITAGSAVFNILIIPVAILIKSYVTFKVFNIPLDRKIILRDGIYLILTNILLIFIIRNETLYWYHGVILIIAYLLYTFYMMVDTQKIALTKSGRIKKMENKNADANNETDEQEERSKYSLEGIVLSDKDINTGNSISLLFASMVILTIGTWLLVLGTELLGRKEYIFLGHTLKSMNVPLIYVSVLLAAAASSIPDTMISIRDTKKGNFQDAISNAFGSNTFDISFALGVPLLAYTLIYHPIKMDLEVRIWSLSMWIMLLFINILVFFIMTIGKRIGKRKGIILLLMYICFVFFVVEEAVGHSITNEIAKMLVK